MARRYHIMTNARMADYRTTRSDLRRRTTARLAAENAPKGVRISSLRAAGRSEGISLQEARELARPPLHTSTKQFSANGCTVREIVRATPWDRNRYGNK